MIAVISDIHSNKDALIATLKDIETRKVDHIFCLGDSIGYLVYPNEVVDILREKKIKTILGNHDRDILKKRFNPKKSPDIFEWTWSKLRDDNKKYLSSLPQKIEVEIDGWNLYLCHGSPNSIEEYCFPNTDITTKAVASIEHDILCCGHTHIPTVEAIGDKYYINPGSAGKPKQGKPSVTYALIDTSKDSLFAEIIEVEYSTEALYKALISEGFFKYAEEIRSGVV